MKDDLDYFNNLFKQIEDYLTNEFFEFNEEKQKNKLRFWNKVPIIISFNKDVKKFLKNKKMDIKKVCVNPDMTVSHLSNILTKDMKDSDAPLAFLAKSGKKNYSILYHQSFKEIYDKYKADDDMLYLEVCKELLWG